MRAACQTRFPSPSPVFDNRCVSHFRRTRVDRIRRPKAMTARRLTGSPCAPAFQKPPQSTGLSAAVAIFGFAPSPGGWSGPVRGEPPVTRFGGHERSWLVGDCGTGGAGDSCWRCCEPVKSGADAPIMSHLRKSKLAGAPMRSRAPVHNCLCRPMSSAWRHCILKSE